MKTSILLLLVTTYGFSVFAQGKLPDENQHNTIEITRGDSVLAFHVVKPGKYFEPGLNRRYYWFDKGALHSSQGAYQGKLLDGLFVAQGLKQKELIEKGTFEKGLRTGLWLTWHTNGEIESKVSYENGRASGIFFRYDDHGKLSQRGKYRKGKIHGKLRTYANGNLSGVAKYRNGDVKTEKTKKTAKVKRVKVKRNTMKSDTSHLRLFRKNKNPDQKTNVDSVKIEPATQNAPTQIRERSSVRQIPQDNLQPTTTTVITPSQQPPAAPSRKRIFGKRDAPSNP